METAIRWKNTPTPTGQIARKGKLPLVSISLSINLANNRDVNLTISKLFRLLLRMLI